MELSLQTSSDPRPEIHEVLLDISNSTVKIGESKVIQEAVVNWLEKDIEVKFPDNVKEGNDLPDVIHPVTKTQGGEITESKVGGLKISQIPINNELKVSLF